MEFSTWLLPVKLKPDRAIFRRSTDISQSRTVLADKLESNQEKAVQQCSVEPSDSLASDHLMLIVDVVSVGSTNSSPQQRLNG